MKNKHKQGSEYSNYLIFFAANLDIFNQDISIIQDSISFFRKIEINSSF